MRGIFNNTSEAFAHRSDKELKQLVLLFRFRTESFQTYTRRAEENTAIAGQSSIELALLQREIKQRSTVAKAL